MEEKYQEEIKILDDIIMDNKYYTPEILEFYPGFEFEFQGVDNYWNKTGWDRHILVAEKKQVGVWKATMSLIESVYLNENEIDWEETVRAKYLDQEDIESFEFKDIDSLWFEHSSGDYRLRKWKGEIDIYRWYSKDDYQIIFRGKIKNKSVLKQILGMVGVL